MIPILKQFSAKLKRWMKACPLIALSFLVFVFIAFAGHRLAKWGRLWNRVAPNIFLAELMAQAIRAAFVMLGLAYCPQPHAMLRRGRLCRLSRGKRRLAMRPATRF